MVRLERRVRVIEVDLARGFEGNRSRSVWAIYRTTCLGVGLTRDRFSTKIRHGATAVRVHVGFSVSVRGEEERGGVQRQV